MPRFLIELPHEAEPTACIDAVRVLATSGSHLLTHADYGCLDGDHRAWITVDVQDRAAAVRIVPPFYRCRARVVALNKFSREDIAELERVHGGDACGSRPEPE